MSRYTPRTHSGCCLALVAAQRCSECGKAAPWRTRLFVPCAWHKQKAALLTQDGTGDRRDAARRHPSTGETYHATYPYPHP